MFVCPKCNEVVSSNTYRRAGNFDAWALGERRDNGFHVRRVVWGLLMAQAEVRFNEEIRRCVIMVERDLKKRPLVAPDLKPQVNE